MVILRDMIESDIDDYVRWFTTCTEWSNWDAPWEVINPKDDERKLWTDYYKNVKDLGEKVERTKFEIEVDGIHIGWVSAYYDLEYVENSDRIIAVGIDIPDETYRNKGYGTTSLIKFVDYLRKFNHDKFFIQTWSGNIPMIKVIQKLGFTEYCRKKDLRLVNDKFYDAITFIKTF